MSIVENERDLDSWPDWFLNTRPEMSVLIEKVTTLHARLNESVIDGFHYHSLSDIEIRAHYLETFKKGIVDQDGNLLKRNVVLTKKEKLIEIHQIAYTVRLLELFISAKKVILVQMIQVIHNCVKNSQLLVALICYRSIIEHVAVFALAINELSSQELKKPKTFSEAILVLEEIDACVARRLYGTRVDWPALMTNSIEKLLNEKRDIRYKTPYQEFDLSAEQILKSIDKLDKSVAGIRAMYEVLCEFAHPNVGSKFGISISSKLIQDENGIIWSDRILGLGPPLFMSEQLNSLLYILTQRLLFCLEHFEQLLEKTNSIIDFIYTTNKLLVQTCPGVWDLIDPYAPCPCGRNQKAKFCCRKK